jgi:hypothetical protein
MKSPKAKSFVAGACAATFLMGAAASAHAHASCDHGADVSLTALVVVISFILVVALARHVRSSPKRRA